MIPHYDWFIIFIFTDGMYLSVFTIHLFTVTLSSVFIEGRAGTQTTLFCQRTPAFI